jgi:hypothetical protein
MKERFMGLQLSSVLRVICLNHTQVKKNTNCYKTDWRPKCKSLKISSGLRIPKTLKERFESDFLYVLGKFKIICKILVSYAILSTHISKSWSEIIISFVKGFLCFWAVRHKHLIFSDFSIVKIVIVSVNMWIFPAFDPVIMLL